MSEFIPTDENLKNMYNTSIKDLAKKPAGEIMDQLRSMTDEQMLILEKDLGQEFKKLDIEMEVVWTSIIAKKKKELGEAAYQDFLKTITIPSKVTQK